MIKHRISKGAFSYNELCISTRWHGMEKNAQCSYTSERRKSKTQWGATLHPSWEGSYQKTQRITQASNRCGERTEPQYATGGNASEDTCMSTIWRSLKNMWRNRTIIQLSQYKVLTHRKRNRSVRETSVPHVYCNSVHNSQEIHSIQVPADGWAGKEVVVHTYGSVSYRLWRGGSPIIPNHRDGPGAHYVTWNKPGTEKQRSHDITVLWNRQTALIKVQSNDQGMMEKKMGQYLQT